MNNFDLDKIKDIISKQYGWGAPSDWTNFHFKELSREIQEVTGDRISEETLKRIFGKRKVDADKYQPQAFSQMALAKFVESFDKQKSPKIIVSKTTRSIISIVVVSIVLVILFFGFYEKPKNYSFSCENSEDYYPFTAAFHYNVSEIKDSVFGRFKYNEEIYLPPDKSRVNFFFTSGGTHKVLFYTREKILDSLSVASYSKDWQGGFYPNNEPGQFEPFIDQIFYRQSDYFYAHPEPLKTEGADLKERFYTAYKYFYPFNKSLDSLTLITRLMNNESTGSYLCYDIGISLISDTEKLIDFKFTQPKCSRYATLRVSERYLDGEYSDLSALSVDMSDWLEIKMKTEKGNFNLFLSDRPVFSENYEMELGNLAGIIIYFFGSGKIDYLELIDKDSTTFYKNEF